MGAEQCKVRDAVLYLLAKAPHRLSRTQIMKLLFLADLKARKRLGSPITGVEYVRYYYGPFSRQIAATVADLATSSGLVREDYRVTSLGRELYTYELTRDVDVSGLDLSAEERELIDEVVRQWARRPLDEMLDYVYRLREVAETKPGDRIPLASTDR